MKGWRWRGDGGGGGEGVVVEVEEGGGGKRCSCKCSEGEGLAISVWSLCKHWLPGACMGNSPDEYPLVLCPWYDNTLVIKRSVGASHTSKKDH